MKSEAQSLRITADTEPAKTWFVRRSPCCSPQTVDIGDCHIEVRHAEVNEKTPVRIASMDADLNWRLAIAGGLLVVPGLVLAGTYNFTDISNPNDPAFTQLLGINKSSTIAGYWGDGAVVPNHGFTLTLPNTFTSENFPGPRKPR